MRRRHTQHDETAELNMMPLMNIIMLLIPFLLMSSQFLKVGVLNAALPKQMDKGEKPPKAPIRTQKKKLQLTVAVTEKGFTLLTPRGPIARSCASSQGAVIYLQKAEGVTFPKREGAYNFDALRRCLVRIKALFSREERVILMVAPKVTYQQVVRVMDTTRRDDKGQRLFPQIAFSPGVQ